MKLTSSEQRELEYLRESQKSKTIPMLQESQNRLKYLNRKEIHNCCTNPFCSGYEGIEEETVCPNCRSKLYKCAEVSEIKQES